MGAAICENVRSTTVSDTNSYRHKTTGFLLSSLYYGTRWVSDQKATDKTASVNTHLLVLVLLAALN